MKKRVSKVQPLITKIWRLILILLLISGIGLLFLQNSNQIKTVDNMKEHVTVLAEQIQNVSNKLVLNTKVNLSAANGKGGVDLDWSNYDSNRENI